MANAARKASIEQNKVDIEALNYHRADGIRAWEKQQVRECVRVCMCVFVQWKQVRLICVDHKSRDADAHIRHVCVYSKRDTCTYTK